MDTLRAIKNAFCGSNDKLGRILQAPAGPASFATPEDGYALEYYGRVYQQNDYDRYTQVETTHYQVKRGIVGGAERLEPEEQFIPSPAFNWNPQPGFLQRRQSAHGSFHQSQLLSSQFAGPQYGGTPPSQIFPQGMSPANTQYHHRANSVPLPFQAPHRPQDGPPFQPQHAPIPEHQHQGFGPTGGVWTVTYHYSSGWENGSSTYGGASPPYAGGQILASPMSYEPSQMSNSPIVPQSQALGGWPQFQQSEPATYGQQAVPPRRSTTPVPGRCLTCGHTISNGVNGNMGCPYRCGCCTT